MSYNEPIFHRTQCTYQLSNHQTNYHHQVESHNRMSDLKRKLPS